jgi:preprotein translocase subunit Sss1
MERSFVMEEKKEPNNAVKNVFKNGRMPTREEYTKLWIRLINQIEREKARQ